MIGRFPVMRESDSSTRLNIPRQKPVNEAIMPINWGSSQVWPSNKEFYRYIIISRMRVVRWHGAPLVATGAATAATAATAGANADEACADKPRCLYSPKKRRPPGTATAKCGSRSRRRFLA